MIRRTWSDDELIAAVKNSFSLSEVSRKLGLKGGITGIKRAIKRLNLSTSHFDPLKNLNDLRHKMSIIRKEELETLTTKKCVECLLHKNKEEFNKNSSLTDGCQSRCRECDKSRAKKFYALHKIKMKKSTAKCKYRRRLRHREFIINYLKEHPCVDCGESNIVVLEFDHVRDKHKPISLMMGVYSLDRIKNEIDKCEVRCANCHRMKTAKQFNWYKAL